MPPSNLDIVNPVVSIKQVPFFMAGKAGEIFAVCYMPVSRTRGGILFFPPFAEEMNKSRRMIASAARKLAASGYAVLIVDPFGTGDSQGDFGDARWSIWRDDMAMAVEWLRGQGIARISFWGLRTGALLAADTSAFLGQKLDRLVLWAPVIRGDLFISQFLRLKVAAGMLAGSGGLTTKDLRAVLSAGQALEVAGYKLMPPLVDAIEGLRLRDILPSAFQDVYWFEVVTEPGMKAGPAVTQLVDVWRTAKTVSFMTIAGETFWNTTEIATIPDLIDATAAVFNGNGAVP